MRYFKNYQPSSDLLSLGFIILCPMALFWRWVLKGEVLFWGTLLLQFWPWHHLVKTNILHGEWPLWNPLLGNGTPLLANFQSAVFYPPNLIYLLLPIEHALTFSVMAHIILAGVLMYVYMRHLDLQPFAATISALTFMLSGYLVGRMQFVTMVNAIAWFPLLLLISDNIAARRAKINILWLGIVLAIQLLAGHAQLWFYGLWLIGAYILFRSTYYGRVSYTPRFVFLGQSVLYLAIAVIIAFLLAAVQVLPTAEFVTQSSRSTGADHTLALTYSFWPWRFITLLAPDFFGHPAQGNYWGYANYWEDHAYMGVLPFILALIAIWQYCKSILWQDHHFNVSKTQKQIVPFFAILIPISLLLALGWNTPVYLWVFETIPGFDLFRGPARLLIWYTIALAVLAGVGAQVFVSTPTNRPHWRRLLMACVALTTASFIAEFLLAGRSLTFLTATRSLGTLFILSIILLLIQPETDETPNIKQKSFFNFSGVSRVITKPFWQGLVIIFIGADLLLTALPLMQTLPASVFSQHIASAEFLKTQPEPDRFFTDNQFAYNIVFNQYFQFKAFGPLEIAYWQGVKEALVSNFGVYAGLPTANNDDPLVVGRWQHLTQWLQYANINRQARALSMMNVGYLISTTDNNWPIIHQTKTFAIQRVPNVLPRAYFVPHAYVAQNRTEAMDRLMDPNFDPHQEVIIMADGEHLIPAANLDVSSGVSSVDVKEVSSNRLELTVNAPSPGFVVLTDTFYPGWQATIDGQMVIIWPANAAFRAVTVDSGPHTINFSYQPRSFTFGLWTSVIACLIIIVIIGNSYLRNPASNLKTKNKTY